MDVQGPETPPNEPEPPPEVEDCDCDCIVR